MGQQRPTRKDKDEREQVERQRHDPQERQRRQVGRQRGRDPSNKLDGSECQRRPGSQLAETRRSAAIDGLHLRAAAPDAATAQASVKIASTR